jgi:integrase
MKGGRKHTVPLSARAAELLQALPKESADGFIFVGPRPGAGLSNMSMTAVLRRMGFGHVTTHGFRSSFRDWCAERTNFSREVAEMALAHAVGDKVEAAYRRGDLSSKRRQLAEAWSKYCCSPSVTGATVTPIRWA